ncbi:MAG: WbqC family protein [Bacteroidales bacterium]|nr:WbqC family protein [Bacteroidales bacterium]
MIVGLMQPYLFPYIGYFQLINAVDIYIIYDDVNYIKGGWINRNNILVNSNKQLFSISLENASPNRIINDIVIKDDFKKFRKTIEQSYIKAPFYEEANELIGEILSFSDKRLSAFIQNSIMLINKYLQISTNVLMSSDLKKDNSLKGEAKVISICNLLGATIYVNAIGGMPLYHRDNFLANGIELKFLQTKEIFYKQFKNEFIPFLSIIDVLMFNDIEVIKTFLNKYEFV